MEVLGDYNVLPILSYMLYKVIIQKSSKLPKFPKKIKKTVDRGKRQS